VELEDRVGLSAEDRAALASEVARLTTLHDLILWGVARGTLVSDVVVQDEFTHDVVMPIDGGRALVFDST